MKPKLVLHPAQAVALIRTFPKIQDQYDIIEMGAVQPSAPHPAYVRYSFDYAKPKPVRTREAQWKQERRGFRR